MPAVADFEAPAVAPEWSKFAGARLADLSSDDLRELREQARVVTVRLVVERELRRRACRQAQGQTARAFPAFARMPDFPAGFQAAGVTVVSEPMIAAGCRVAEQLSMLAED